jgi:hypothetical protein
MHMRFLVPLAALISMVPRAEAQPVTFQDLDSHVVTATIVYARTLRRLDDGRVVNNTSTQTITLTIGPGDRIDQVHAVAVTGPDGRPRGNTSFSATFELNKPRKGRTGEVIWLFDEGKLVRLQTFESGGRRITMAFTKSPTGLSCTIDAPFAREGEEPIQNRAALGNFKVQLLNVRLTSARCRVERRQ